MHIKNNNTNYLSPEMQAAGMVPDPMVNERAANNVALMASNLDFDIRITKNDISKIESQNIELNRQKTELLLKK